MQIIFTYFERGRGGKIRLLDVATREVSTIDVPFPSVDNVDWSSTGGEIVFSAFPPLKIPEPREGIFLMDSHGNLQRTILMEVPPSITDGLAWSPDGQKIVFSQDGDLYTLDLASEAIELFIKSASSPDWKDPARPRSVSPRNKRNTTWGELKKPGR